MTSMIASVTGPLPAEDVAGADAHCHLWIRPAVPDSPVVDDQATAVDELKDFRGAGGNLVLDCQPGMTGRDGKVLAHMATAAGISVVASTGFHLIRYYKQGTGPWSMNDDQAARCFLGELTSGMEEAPEVRAGCIKSAWTEKETARDS